MRAQITHAVTGRKYKPAKRFVEYLENVTGPTFKTREDTPESVGEVATRDDPARRVLRRVPRAFRAYDAFPSPRHFM